jgi:uncharacterized protein (TIGR02270 family)
VTATATATYIVDILDEHLDELGFLFGQWRSAQRDPDYSLSAVADLEERIRGHQQGIQVPGDKAWPRLLELLAGDDADLVFAAAYSLLHTARPEHIAAVLAAFATAEEELLTACTAALAYGPLDARALEQVRALLSTQPTTRAAAAAEVLVLHDSLRLTAEQLRYFLEDEDPAARQAGWKLAALLGAELPPHAYAAALRDADPAVTIAALETGAWCGVPGVLPALRRFVDPATPGKLDALYILAVLGAAEDTVRLQAAVSDTGLGPSRFALAGAFGSPALMPLVLAGMQDADPAAAAAAGTAFMRLTGVDIESNTSAAVPPDDGSEPDEFEAEFQAEVFLPDPVKAAKAWEELAPQLHAVPRLCRGVDATRGGAVHGVDVDMQSRRELCMRARFTRAAGPSLRDLTLFPQGISA